jgi:hypothetical protein
MSEIRVEDYVYMKKTKCEVCDKEFDAQTIRQGKNPLVDQDSDLRPNYKFVDAVLYDVIHCPRCGYTALSRYFNKITDRQGDDIKKGMMGRHVDHNYPLELNPQQALERYKMAIIISFMKKAKESEKGLLYLKTAWVYRAINSAANERSFITQAYNSLLAAYTSESMPIAGMDEAPFTYLLAELARKNGKIDESAGYVVRVLQLASASKELKSKAETIREFIKEARSGKK